MTDQGPNDRRRTLEIPFGRPVQIALAVVVLLLLIVGIVIWTTRDDNEAPPIAIAPQGGGQGGALGAPVQDQSRSSGVATPETGVSSDQAAGFAGGAYPSYYPQPVPTVTQNGITTSGSGAAVTTPDRASWTFTVSATADSARAATRAIGRKQDSVVEALKDQGVDEDDIQTQSVSLYPQYDYNGNPPYRLINYAASSSIVVETSVAHGGELVDAAVKAGADQFYGPTLSASTTESLYREAVADAFQKAKERAETLARAAGVELGEPVAIAASDPGYTEPPVVYDRLAGAESGVPISPGQTMIQASVTVTFAIK